jgi:PTS system nitrogen regulatory IIA component
MPAAGATVNLADIYPPERILVGVANTKREAVRELVHHLAVRGVISPADEEYVAGLVLRREKGGTTALGHGIAFPHCSCGLVHRFTGVIGHYPLGIAFDSVDGELVNTVFLLLAPLHSEEQMFELLGKSLAIGRDKTLRLQLGGCRSPEAIHHLLEELE